MGAGLDSVTRRLYQDDAEGVSDELTRLVYQG